MEPQQFYNVTFFKFLPILFWKPCIYYVKKVGNTSHHHHHHL